MPTPLVLTAAQTTAFQALLSPGNDPVANPLACALGQGVDTSTSSSLIPAIAAWSTLTTAQQQSALNGLCQGFAALASAFGLIPPSGPPGINATVTLAMLTPSGTEGSMTFVGGLLTAYTAPT